MGAIETTALVQLTHSEQTELVSILRAEATEAYEIACGNWGNPSDTEADALYARSEMLTALADRLS